MRKCCSITGKWATYSLSSATARMGKQNHQTIGKGIRFNIPKGYSERNLAIKCAQYSLGLLQEEDQALLSCKSSSPFARASFISGLGNGQVGEVSVRIFLLRYYCYFLYAYLLKDSSYRLVSCAVKRSVYYLQTAVCYEVSMYTPAVLPCQDTCR